jgi:hypothetical protein
LALVAGIDEAGFGPVLGPLVVSSSLFSVPDGLEGESMWRMLSGAVCRRASRRRWRVAIADSKRLYGGLRGGRGLEGLERGVLAMLACRGPAPGSLRELLETISPGAIDAARAYPWYSNGERSPSRNGSPLGGLDLPLPRSASAADVALASKALQKAMEQAGLKLLEIRSETVFEGEYNRLASASNKSLMLFDVTCRLLMRLWRAAGSRRLIVHADRQGGRQHYLGGLQRAFEGCSFKIIEEDNNTSAYRITSGTKEAEFHFTVGGEEAHLPVALASMASKYLRELFMELLNGFWAGWVPGLAPTAGYYTDGRRFHRDIAPAVKQLGIDERMLYRIC